MLNHGINSPLTTSCGRLFDAVAAIIGIRERVSYEGQAAIELEAALADAAGEEPYPIGLIPDGMEGLAVLDPAPMWRPLLGDLCDGRSPSVVAARFHMGLVNAAADMVAHLAARHDQLRGDYVALSGGVFQNVMLLEGLSGHS
jgi:hydrogenase maturation protein HypF